jgi:hypothetical protein
MVLKANKGQLNDNSGSATPTAEKPKRTTKAEQAAKAALRIQAELAGEYPEDAQKEHEEQPIIEVSQDQLKEALKSLLVEKDNIMKLLYAKHEEYNQEFFQGELSIPLITIERMDNRTLGNYTYSGNNIPIDNHIRFNMNFIALNTPPHTETADRVLETLKHEMIHQWQDQVLYYRDGQEPRTIKLATRTSEDEVTYTEIEQKKFPRERHNKDFKDMADVVGIPARGSKCYGNPANMPTPKSYNRKFRCACEGSNGHGVTIWSTREIIAECQVCGEMFEEVVKDTRGVSETIEVKASHVEKQGQDAVMDHMLEKFKHFHRFESKQLKDAFIDDLAQSEFPAVQLESGSYQKGHNAYGLGYRYWIAYNTTEINPDTIFQAVDDTVIAEEPKVEELPKPKARTRKPKAVPAEPVIEEPAPEPEPIVEEPEARVWDIENPQDLMDAYRMNPTTRAAAEVFGVHQTTYIRRIQKHGIDLNKVITE